MVCGNRTDLGTPLEIGGTLDNHGGRLYPPNVDSAMDAAKVDIVMQFALAVSRCIHDADDWQLRELGDIHLLKYVYLADLGAAEETGKTFTRTDWQFYDFGPWSPEAHREIPAAMKAIGADRREFDGKFGKTVRYSLPNLEDAELVCKRLENKLPTSARLRVRRSLRRCGNDTPNLLKLVYNTRPMLSASPRQFLSFERRRKPDAAPELPAPTSAKQKKRYRAKVREIRERLAASKDARRQHEEELKQRFAPVVDEDYFEILETLDGSDEAPPRSGILEFGPGVWEARKVVFKDDHE
jgi:hypothetical protein